MCIHETTDTTNSTHNFGYASVLRRHLHYSCKAVQYSTGVFHVPSYRCRGGGGRCSVLAMVQQLLASTRVPLSCSRKRLPLAQSQGETAGMDTHIQGHRGGPGARESSGHLKLLEIADHVKDLAGPGRFAGRLEDKGAVGLPPQHEPFPLLAQLATLLS